MCLTMFGTKLKQKLALLCVPLCHICVDFSFYVGHRWFNVITVPVISRLM